MSHALVHAAAAPVGSGLPDVARPAFAASAALIVESGPAALLPAEEARREQYLQAIGQRLLKRPEPHAWMIGASLLQGSQAMGIVIPGSGHIPISADVAGDPEAASTAVERTRRSGLNDPLAVLMLASRWVPSMYSLDGSQVVLQLSKAAPRNAYSWLVMANFASAGGDDGEVIKFLQRANSAPEFNDYHGDVVRLFIRESESLPPSELRQVDGLYRSRAIEQLILATFVANQSASPWAKSFVPMDCSHATPLPEIRRVCVDALERVVAQMNTFVGGQRALQTLRILAKSDTQREAADRQLRNLAWQQEKLYELGFAIADIVTEAEASIADWQRGGTEVSVGIARLQRHHIPLEPPAEWQPKPRAMVRLY